MFKMLVRAWGSLGGNVEENSPLELPPIAANRSSGAAQCPAVESRRQLKIYLIV